MSSTRPPRDPIIQDKPGLAGGSVKNASAGKIKSISGGGPNLSSKSANPRDGFPVPNNPYKGG